MRSLSQSIIANNSRTTVLLGGALRVAAVVLAIIYLAPQSADYREVMIIGGALIAGVIVLGGEWGIRLGFVLWALSMAIGYRTFEVKKDLRIHPAEVLLWLLFTCVLAHRRLITENRVSLPMWVCLSMPFWLFGWWPLIAGDAEWAGMLSEFRSFVIFIPLLFVAQIVLKQKQDWRYVLTAFFLASTWIAFMGSLEYWVPSVMRLFPAFIKSAKAEAAADGFVRAQFSFWGNQSATFLCLLACPLALVLIRWWRGLLARVAIVTSAVLQLVAIYIGGFRSIWLMVVVQVAAGCFFGLRKRGLVVAALCVLVAAVGYQLIPKTEERVITTIAVLQGAPIDHSALVRQERALGAVDHIVENPLGSGWHSAGWVHSDFLQVGANLGILAALIFVGGYLFTFWKLAVTVKTASAYPRGAAGELGFPLLLSFIGVGGLLATQGVEVLPQLMLPVWFIWVMVDVWLRQRSEATELSYAYAPSNFYPAANLQ